MIKFGIPSLDYLIGFDSSKNKVQKREYDNKSICIVGAPGTSKSIFALHLAATQCSTNEKMRVLYVSTDWSVELAKKALEGFQLNNYPDRVADPYTRRRPKDLMYLESPKPVEIFELRPESEDFSAELIKFARCSDGLPKIGFLDLKAQTAGDDWNHILKVVSLLPQLTDDEITLMVIVDAIEGIELLAGASDQFGQPRSRRQRIAQFARLVGTHEWALVIEDRGALHDVPDHKEGHYDEEFISDIVMRLGIREVSGYAERFVQINKCRGSVHQLGRHPFLLRDGSGSKSSGWNNADDPLVGDPNNPQSYVYVVRSIHSRASALLSGRRGAI